jgi:hypothetical protein
MKTEITLEHLFNLINTHLESGGVVIDTYGHDRESNIIGRVFYMDEEYTSYLRLVCAGEDHKGTTIPSSDILTLEGHEVGYTPNSHFGYLGKIAFLNPAPVDLCPRADAVAAYAAAVSRCNRATDARDAAAADARDAAAAADAAADAADDAYAAMVAAKTALARLTR